jgi:hypothetical protein
VRVHSASIGNTPTQSMSSRRRQTWAGSFTGPRGRPGRTAKPPRTWRPRAHVTLNSWCSRRRRPWSPSTARGW